MSKDDNYTNVILEEMNSKFALVLEAVAPIKQLQVDVSDIKDRLTSVESDMKVIKAVITDQSHVLNDHETRITSLETA